MGGAQRHGNKHGVAVWHYPRVITGFPGRVTLSCPPGTGISVGERPPGSTSSAPGLPSVGPRRAKRKRPREDEEDRPATCEPRGSARQVGLSPRNRVIPEPQAPSRSRRPPRSKLLWSASTVLRSQATLLWSGMLALGLPPRGR